MNFGGAGRLVLRPTTAGRLCADQAQLTTTAKYLSGKAGGILKLKTQSQRPFAIQSKAQELSS